MQLQRKNRLRALALGAVALSGALALTACGSDDTGGSGTSTGAAKNGSIACGDARGELLAAGSSAQQNAIDAWVKQYTAVCRDVRINYNPSGSGAGVTSFLQGQTAFSGSDSALRPEEIEKSRKVCRGSQAIDLPMLGGPIAVVHHLPGVDDLVLDAPTLAKIFDNRITTWNAPEIKRLNPGVKLPGTRIQAFHRSDESGTTDNFTTYLKAAAPDDWSYPGGKSWPTRGGQSAAGSSGLVQQVKQTEGALSYVELSYVRDGLDTVRIKTQASEPVEATVENASKAIAEAEIVGKGKDLALKLDHTPSAEGAYPITQVTYEIVCAKGNRADTLPATRSFLGYIAGKDGQALLKQASYAPLPDKIAARVRSTIADLG